MNTGQNFLVNDQVAFPKRRMKANQVIFREGDVADMAFIILRGEVEITALNKAGETVRLTTLTKGQMFGEMALLKGNVRSATATTKSECDIVMIQREKLLNKLNNSDSIVRYWVEHLTDRVIDLTKRFQG